MRQAGRGSPPDPKAGSADRGLAAAFSRQATGAMRFHVRPEWHAKSTGAQAASASTAAASRLKVVR